MDVVGTWNLERVTCTKWGLSSPSWTERSCVRSCCLYAVLRVLLQLQVSPSRPWRPFGLWPLLEVPPAALPCPACSAKAADGSVGSPARCDSDSPMLPIEAHQARWTSANSTEPEDSQTRSTAFAEQRSHLPRLHCGEEPLTVL
jgi:hypothetical protein